MYPLVPDPHHLLTGMLTHPQVDATRQRALREAALNSALSHPNIVSTYAHELMAYSSEGKSSTVRQCGF